MIAPINYLSHIQHIHRNLTNADLEHELYNVVLACDLGEDGNAAQRFVRSNVVSSYAGRPVYEF